VYIAAGVVVAFGVASVVAYYKLAVPAMRNAPPVSEDDLKYCREIVKQGKGFPWVCSRALRTGRCPCQPCAKVGAARGRE
jgi:hypothetical protein